MPRLRHFALFGSRHSVEEARSIAGLVFAARVTVRLGPADGMEPTASSFPCTQGGR